MMAPMEALTGNRPRNLAIAVLSGTAAEISKSFIWSSSVPPADSFPLDIGRMRV